MLKTWPALAMHAIAGGSGKNVPFGPTNGDTPGIEPAIGYP